MTSQVEVYTKKGKIRERLEINYSESEDVILHVASEPLCLTICVAKHQF